MMGNLAKYFGLIKETLLCGKQRDAAFGKKQNIWLIKNAGLSLKLRGLISYLTLSDGAWWPSATMAKVTFWRTWFFIKILFSDHNFWTRNANKPIKGSKDSIVALFLIKTWAKIGFWRWRPRPDNHGPKCVNLPQLWCHFQKPLIQSFPVNTKLNYKPFRIFRRFDQLSSSIGRQVMTGKIHWHYSSLR